jgi:DNA-binding NtrC family response regulator
LALARTDTGDATLTPSGVAVRPSFDVLDDVVRQRQSWGVLAANVANAADCRAVAAHVERRARAQQRDVVRAAAEVENAWGDVAVRLGVVPVPLDPVEAGRAIAARASARGAVVIVPVVAAGAWDEAVCQAVVEAAPSALFVLLAQGCALEARGANWFDFGTSLNEPSAARWWEAALSALNARRGDGLGDLERWLDHAIDLAENPAGDIALGAGERDLLRRLGLARRAWPESKLGLLGSELALGPLASKGIVDRRDGWVAASPARADLGESPPAELLRVAESLDAAFPADCWALARAAELFAAASDRARAESCMERALAAAADPAARAQLWSRWHSVVEAHFSAERTLLCVRAGELALALGDVDTAIDWAEQAARSEDGPRALHLLGRALLARGDLVAAEASLNRAGELAREPGSLAEIAVDRAEVRFASGDLTGAERLALEAIDAGASGRALLSARNLLGKLLLSRAEWDAAEQHFAADICRAAALGDSLSELRARVNRAIALLSRGSSDEARSLLVEVLQRAEARGEARAVGFALSNLAVLAIERHDYAQALELSERAISVRRRLGDRLGFARDVTNLVELRLRLGLVEQADQVLRFGRQALGPGAPASRLCELALAAARTHLARGRTLEAERELRAALRTAAQASDGDKLGECHRLAARIALEDGVVARADVEIKRAEELKASPFARAELALLQGLVARAAGRPVRDAAFRAVVAARESGDEELAREAHILLAEIALAEDDAAALAEHVRIAAALRDEVAGSLPRETRDAYLARRDMLRLSRLERFAAEKLEDGRLDEDGAEASSLPRDARTAKTRAETRFAGRHPSVCALLDSVKRIGKTQATLLIQGESGTGKELIADAIHAASERASGPLIKVNCAALVESLLMSELFGHEKGAFTGALSRRRGRFERASGGTLFLDEIGDISPRTQVALLRVLEERKIERVGGSLPFAVDVRIVCATHRDLSALVQRGDFREDLYYRLSGITVHVPPLRDRASDIPLLCETLLDRIAAERSEAPRLLSEDALELLMRHRWPGNVRELENVLRAVSLFAGAQTIEQKDLIEHVEALRKLSTAPAAFGSMAPSVLDQARATEPSAHAPASEPPAHSVDAPVTGVAYREIREAGVSLSELKRRIERECICRALRDAEGNITRAAAMLGMKRPRLSQLVKQYGLLAGEERDR